MDNDTHHEESNLPRSYCNFNGEFAFKLNETHCSQIHFPLWPLIKLARFSLHNLKTNTWFGFPREETIVCKDTLPVSAPPRAHGICILRKVAAKRSKNKLQRCTTFTVSDALCRRPSNSSDKSFVSDATNLARPMLRREKGWTKNFLLARTRRKLWFRIRNRTRSVLANFNFNTFSKRKHTFDFRPPLGLYIIIKGWVEKPNGAPTGANA